jgi:hypothetical protein
MEDREFQIADFKLQIAEGRRKSTAESGERGTMHAWGEKISGSLFLVQVVLRQWILEPTCVMQLCTTRIVSA